MTVPTYLGIQYGDVTAPSTVNNCTLTLIELNSLRRDRESFEVKFSALLTTPTGLAADFVGAVNNIENAWSRPYQQVRVFWTDPAGVEIDQTILQFRQFDASGLEIQAEVSKPGTEGLDTQLSRRYDVTVSGGLPPQSEDGAREETYDLTTDANCRRRLVVRGDYTAVPLQLSAAAHAAAKIAAKSAALIATLGTTTAWKLVRHDVTNVSTNDLEASAEQEWEERIFRDSAATENDDRLRRVKLAIRRTKEGATGAPSVRRLATIVGTYEAEVCHNETTDLLSLYETSISPWIVANMRLSAPGTFFAIVSEDADLERTDNRITATIVALSSSGGNLIELERTEVLDVQHGGIVADVWDAQASIDSEDPTSAYVWPGPKAVTFTETLRQVTIGAAKSLRPAGAYGAGLGPQPAANNPFANLFGVGAISKPGESFLSFLGPEAAGTPRAGGLFRGAGGGGGGAGASGAGAAGVVHGFKVSTQHSSKPGVRGIYPTQFEVEEATTVRTTRYVKGVGAGSGGAQPKSNGTRSRPK